MKGMKKKLAAAAAMLVVSAVMLSGVSYAWYTLSTNPTVENITANIAANENLEIALDNNYADEDAVDTASIYNSQVGVQGSTTGNPYTWGNVVDLTYAMTTGGIGANLKLAPVKYDATVTGTGTAPFKYPQYGTDGRVSTLANMFGAYITDKAGVTANGGVQVIKQTADATVYDALAVTYWLRSNEACDVTLSANAVKRAGSTNDASATTTDVNGVMGEGSFIEIPLAAGTENTIDRVDDYVKNLVVQFNVGANTYYAKLTKSTTPGEAVDATSTVPGKVRYYLALDTNKNSAAATNPASISLTANTAQKVTMSVYIDGETVTNADALLDDIANMDMSIQFQSSKTGTTNSQTTTPGAMNGTTYVAPTGP